MTHTSGSFFATFTKEIQQAEFEEDFRIRNPKFRKFIINKQGTSLVTLKMFRDSLATTVQKPQRCLYDDRDWYLAIDTYTSTFYVCYRNLMMIDIDYGKGNEYTDSGEIVTRLTAYCEKNPEVLMDIYQSRKGVHVFMIHQTYDYHDDSSLELMLELGCDFYYVIYASLRGWSVRVNAKLGEQIPIYTHLTRIGTGKPTHELECLVQLHVNFLPVFSNVMESKMY